MENQITVCLDNPKEILEARYLSSDSDSSSSEMENDDNCDILDCKLNYRKVSSDSQGSKDDNAYNNKTDDDKMNGDYNCKADAAPINKCSEQTELLKINDDASPRTNLPDLIPDIYADSDMEYPDTPPPLPESEPPELGLSNSPSPPPPPLPLSRPPLLNKELNISNTLAITPEQSVKSVSAYTEEEEGHFLSDYDSDSTLENNSESEDGIREDAQCSGADNEIETQITKQHETSCDVDDVEIPDISDIPSIQQTFLSLLSDFKSKNAKDSSMDFDEEFEAIFNTLNSTNTVPDVYQDRFAGRRDKYGFILSPIIESPSPTPSSMSGYSGLSSVSPDPFSMFRVSPAPRSGKRDIDLSSLSKAVSDQETMGKDEIIPIYQNRTKLELFIPENTGWESDSELLTPCSGSEWDSFPSGLSTPPVNKDMQIAPNHMSLKGTKDIIYEEAESSSACGDSGDSDDTLAGSDTETVSANKHDGVSAISETIDTTNNTDAQIGKSICLSDERNADNTESISRNHLRNELREPQLKESEMNDVFSNTEDTIERVTVLMANENAIQVSNPNTEHFSEDTLEESCYKSDKYENQDTNIAYYSTDSASANLRETIMKLGAQLEESDGSYYDSDDDDSDDEQSDNGTEQGTTSFSTNIHTEQTHRKPEADMDELNLNLINLAQSLNSTAYIFVPTSSVVVSGTMTPDDIDSGSASADDSDSPNMSSYGSGIKVTQYTSCDSGESDTCENTTGYNETQSDTNVDDVVYDEQDELKDHEINRQRFHSPLDYFFLDGGAVSSYAQESPRSPGVLGRHYNDMDENERVLCMSPPTLTNKENECKDSVNKSSSMYNIYSQAVPETESIEDSFITVQFQSQDHNNVLSQVEGETITGVTHQFENQSDSDEEGTEFRNITNLHEQSAKNATNLQTKRKMKNFKSTDKRMKSPLKLKIANLKRKTSERNKIKPGYVKDLAKLFTEPGDEEPESIADEVYCRFLENVSGKVGKEEPIVQDVYEEESYEHNSDGNIKEFDNKVTSFSVMHDYLGEEREQYIEMDVDFNHSLDGEIEVTPLFRVDNKEHQQTVHKTILCENEVEYNKCCVDKSNEEEQYTKPTHTLKYPNHCQNFSKRDKLKTHATQLSVMDKGDDQNVNDHSIGGYCEYKVERANDTSSTQSTYCNETEPFIYTKYNQNGEQHHQNLSTHVAGEFEVTPFTVVEPECLQDTNDSHNDTSLEYQFNSNINCKPALAKYRADLTDNINDSQENQSLSDHEDREIEQDKGETDFDSDMINEYKTETEEYATRELLEQRIEKGVDINKSPECDKLNYDNDGDLDKTSFSLVKHDNVEESNHINDNDLDSIPENSTNFKSVRSEGRIERKHKLDLASTDVTLSNCESEEIEDVGSAHNKDKLETEIFSTDIGKDRHYLGQSDKITNSLKTDPNVYSELCIAGDKDKINQFVALGDPIYISSCGDNDNAEKTIEAIKDNINALTCNGAYSQNHLTDSKNDGASNAYIHMRKNDIEATLRSRGYACFDTSTKNHSTLTLAPTSDSKDSFSSDGGGKVQSQQTSFSENNRDFIILDKPFAEQDIANKFTRSRSRENKAVADQAYLTISESCLMTKDKCHESGKNTFESEAISYDTNQVVADSILPEITDIKTQFGSSDADYKTVYASKRYAEFVDHPSKNDEQLVVKWNVYKLQNESTDSKYTQPDINIQLAETSSVSPRRKALPSFSKHLEDSYEKESMSSIIDQLNKYKTNVPSFFSRKQQPASESRRTSTNNTSCTDTYKPVCSDHTINSEFNELLLTNQDIQTYAELGTIQNRYKEQPHTNARDSPGAELKRDIYYRKEPFKRGAVFTQNDQPNIFQYTFYDVRTPINVSPKLLKKTAGQSDYSIQAKRNTVIENNTNANCSDNILPVAKCNDASCDRCTFDFPRSACHSIAKTNFIQVNAGSCNVNSENIDVISHKVKGGERLSTDLTNERYRQDEGVYIPRRLNASENTHQTLAMNDGAASGVNCGYDTFSPLTGINGNYLGKTQAIFHPRMPRSDTSTSREDRVVLSKDTPYGQKPSDSSVLFESSVYDNVIEDEKGRIKGWPYSDLENQDRVPVKVYRTFKKISLEEKDPDKHSTKMRILQTEERSEEMPDDRTVKRLHSSSILPANTSEKQLMKSHSESIQAALQTDANGNTLNEEELAEVIPKLAETVANMQNVNAEEIMPGITQTVAKLKDGGNLVITTMTRKVTEDEEGSSGRASPAHPVLDVDDLENSKIFLVQDSKGDLFYVEDVTSESQESAYFSSSRHTSESESGYSPTFQRISKIKQVGNSGINDSTAEELLSAMYDQNGVTEMDEFEDEYSERTYEFDLPKDNRMHESIPRRDYSKDSFNTSYMVEEPDSMSTHQAQSAQGGKTTTKDHYESSYEVTSAQPWLFDGVDGQYGQQVSYSQAVHGTNEELEKASLLSEADNYNTRVQNLVRTSDASDSGHTVTTEKYTIEAEAFDYPSPQPVVSNETTLYTAPPPVYVPPPAPIATGVQTDEPLQYSLVKVDMTPKSDYKEPLEIAFKEDEPEERPIYKTVAHIETKERPRPKPVDVDIQDSKRYKIITTKPTRQEEVQESHMSLDEVDYRFTKENVEYKLSSPTHETKQFYVRNAARAVSPERFRSEKRVEFNRGSNERQKTEIQVQDTKEYDQQTYEENNYSYDKVVQNTENTDGNMRVVRGSILIKNTLDEIDGTLDDNINMFDGNFTLCKDNPLYQSDEDIYKRFEREKAENARKQERFQRDLNQDITFETVDKFSKSKTGKCQFLIFCTGLNREGFKRIL